MKLTLQFHFEKRNDVLIFVKFTFFEIYAIVFCNVLHDVNFLKKIKNCYILMFFGNKFNDEYTYICLKYLNLKIINKQLYIFVLFLFQINDNNNWILMIKYI